MMLRFRVSIIMIAAAVSTLPIANASIGNVIRVSVTSSGAEVTGDSGFSGNPQLSGDGTIVGFDSLSQSLVTNPVYFGDNCYFHNALTNETILVSRGLSGAAPDDSSEIVDVSLNGRFVLFQSRASNLVVGDTNSSNDVFVYDRQGGQIERVSVGSGGVQCPTWTGAGTISADGRFVTFSTNFAMAPEDTNGKIDVFLRDRALNSTTRVSIGNAGIQGDEDSNYGAISSDGNTVCFVSRVFNFATVSGFRTRVYRRSLLTGHTILVSVNNFGTPANEDSDWASINSDGSVIAFHSLAGNLVPSDNDFDYDVFVRNIVSGTTVLVSARPDGFPGEALSVGPDISNNGRFVSFLSDSSDLVPLDSNDTMDSFVRDLWSNRTWRQSLSWTGAQLDSGTERHGISGDGTRTSFSSWSENVVPNDNNGYRDVFLRHFRNDLINVDAFHVTAGLYFGGILSCLWNSDNDKLFVLCDEYDSVGEIVFVGNVEASSLEFIELTIESSASRQDLTQFIQAFNYASSSFVNCAFATTTFADTLSRGSPMGQASNYLGPGNLVKARVVWIPQADVSSVDGWTQTVDWFFWAP